MKRGPKQIQRKPVSEFTKGYVCAVATLVSAHGKDVEAKYLLSCNEPHDWDQIDEFDRDTLADAGLAPPREKTISAGGRGRQGVGAANRADARNLDARPLATKVTII